jgi:hypothetical protein
MKYIDKQLAEESVVELRKIFSLPKDVLEWAITQRGN